MARINPDIVHTHGQKMTNIIKTDSHFSTIHGTKKNVAAFKKSQFIFGASKKSLEKIQNEEINEGSRKNYQVFYNKLTSILKKHTSLSKIKKKFLILRFPKAFQIH